MLDLQQRKKLLHIHFYKIGYELWQKYVFCDLYSIAL